MTSISGPLCGESVYTGLEEGQNTASPKPSIFKHYKTVFFNSSKLVKVSIVSFAALCLLLVIAIPAAMVTTSKSYLTASGSSSSTSNSTCSTTQIVTEGPYWVDENIDMSDLTSATSYTAMPLTLKLTTYDLISSNNSCNIISGAKVDIWHTNPSGLYSDVQQLNTKGQTWLRGYQLTDSTGLATFKTWYPGWYTGRTVHIHVRVRLYSGSSVTYDQTTQAFFADTITDTVYTTSPYNTRSSRSTRNANDNLYVSNLEFALTGDNTNGFTGTMSVNVPMI